MDACSASQPHPDRPWELGMAGERLVGGGGGDSGVKGNLPPVSVLSAAGLGSSEPLELCIQPPVTLWLHYWSWGRACGAGVWQNGTRAFQGTWGMGRMGLSRVRGSSSDTQDYQEPGTATVE